MGLQIRLQTPKEGDPGARGSFAGGSSRQLPGKESTAHGIPRVSTPDSLHPLLPKLGSKDSSHRPFPPGFSHQGLSDSFVVMLILTGSAKVEQKPPERVQSQQNSLPNGIRKLKRTGSRNPQIIPKPHYSHDKFLHCITHPRGSFEQIWSLPPFWLPLPSTK